MIQDIWLRDIARHYIIKGKGTHLMTVSHCFSVIRNRIHKTLPGVTSTTHDRLPGKLSVEV